MGSKIIPQDAEAEMSVLGAFYLSDDTVAAELLRILDVDDFMDVSNQHIFQAIKSLVNRGGVEIDFIVLGDELKKSGLFEEVGGYEYLTKIVEFTPTYANALYYARVVKERSFRRRLALFGHAIKTAAYDMQTSVPQTINYITKELHNLNVDRDKAAGRDCDSDMSAALSLTAQFDYRMRQGKIKTVKLPWKSLNGCFNGLSVTPGTVGVISSNAGSGKTWLVYQLALSNAQAGLDCFILNSEMSPEVYPKRLMGMLAGSPEIASLTHPELSQEIQNKYGDYIAALPLKITKNGGRDINDAYAEIERRAKNGSTLLIIDHINDLICAKAYEDHPRLVRRLAALARETETTIVIVGHLKAGEDKEIMANSRQMEMTCDWSWSLRKHNESQRFEVYGDSGCHVDHYEVACQHSLFVRKSRFGASEFLIALQLGVTDDNKFLYNDLGVIKTKITGKKQL